MPSSGGYHRKRTGKSESRELTRREMEILNKFLENACSDRDLPEHFGISYTTAKTHMVNLRCSALRATVDYHDNDFYKKDDSITARLAHLEEFKSRSEPDLYNADRGVIPMLTRFFAVLAEREKEANKRLANYTAIVAICAVLAVPAWDLLKHSMGWLK